MLLTKEVEMVCKTRKKYYIEKKYDWEYLKTIIVKLEDLPKGSHQMVKVLCDYCSENGKETIVEKPYYAYLNQKKKSQIDKDCCDDCWHLKLAESMNAKYGKNNASNIKMFQDKRIETFLDKFGTDNPMKVKEVVLKGKQTNIDKYGVDHIMKLEGEYDKRIIKIRETMYQNDSGIKSTQQIYLHKLLGGELNYPFGKCLLDIAFPEDKIYIEYDGSGHDLQVKLGNITEEERQRKELKRFYFMKNNKWKMIRIVSTKDKLPNNKILKYLFNLACYHLQNGHSYFEINIDKGIIKYNNEEMKINFCKLKKINKKSISA